MASGAISPDLLPFRGEWEGEGRVHNNPKRPVATVAQTIFVD